MANPLQADNDPEETDGLSYSPDPGPLPKEKPPHAASFEDEAGGIAANTLKSNGGTFTMAKLKADHPYGDGKHGESMNDTMKRLGAGQPYGGGQ